MTLYLNGILAYTEERSLKKELLSGSEPGEKRNTRPPIFLDLDVYIEMRT